MGFSGANVLVLEDRVIKTGRDARAQALYALDLGIGPPILQIMPDGYVMERLTELPDADPFGVLSGMYLTLRYRVWHRPVAYTETWMTHFEEWSVEQPIPTLPRMRALYENRPEGVRSSCMIHGDPTLSNALFDERGICIADPIRPTGKIPYCPEVDGGKLLQSAIGWEHVMFDTPLMDEEDLVLFAGMLGQGFLERAVFWLMIHALRILPYARRAGGERGQLAEEWSIRTAQIIHRYTGEPACSTLMTLMEHSRTLAKRS